MSDDNDLDAEADSAFMENHLLEDLDSYLDDINSRLTISRMVGDSIIRGMVNAIADESTVTISSKDAKINELNNRLKLYESISPIQSRAMDDGLMSNLRADSEKHFLKFKGEIERTRLNLDEGRSLESLIEMERNIDELRKIISTVFRVNGEMRFFMEESLYEQSWQMEMERRVNASTVQETVRELTEGCERKLLEQKSFFKSKVGELSELLKEMESVSQSVLAVDLDLHHHLTHSSHEEMNNRFESKKKFEISVPDDLSLSPLSHMSKDELTSYYKAEISEIKRQLESSLHEKTEELFRVKRQFHKEKALVHAKREKELKALKKQLPGICLSLDGILLEAKKNYSFQEEANFFEQKINKLSSENKTLQNLILRERERALENYSSMEKILLEERRKLEWEIEDERIEALIRNQVDGCFFNELIHDVRAKTETMEKIYITIFCGSLVDAQSAVNSIMVHVDENKVLSEVINHKDKNLEMELEQKERLREKVESLSTLVNEKDQALLVSEKNLEKLRKELLSLSEIVGEKDSKLSLEVKRSKELDEGIASLQSFVKEKGVLILDLESRLRQQKDEFFQLKTQAQEQERSIRGYKSDLDFFKSRHQEAMKVISQHTTEIFDLNQKLKIACKTMEESEEEKLNLYDIIKEKEKRLSSNAEQMTSMETFIREISRSVEEFERIILRNLEMQSSRSFSQFLLFLAATLMSVYIFYKDYLKNTNTIFFMSGSVDSKYFLQNYTGGSHLSLSVKGSFTHLSCVSCN